MRRDKKIVVLLLGMFLLTSMASISIDSVEASDSPEFVLDGWSVANIEAGEETTIEGEIKNEGEVSDSDYLEIKVEGETVESTEITDLSAGDSLMESYSLEESTVGTYQVEVRLLLSDESWEGAFTVTHGDVSRIDISPTDDQHIVAGDEIQFSADAFDEEENLIEDAEFEWNHADEEGIFKETKAGQYEVSATILGEDESVSSKSVTVTVEANDAHQIVFEEKQSTVIAGENARYSVQIQDRYGNLQEEGSYEVSLERDGEPIQTKDIEDGEYSEYLVHRLTLNPREDQIQVVERNNRLESTETVPLEIVRIEEIKLDSEEDEVGLGEEINISVEAIDEDGNTIGYLNEEDFTWINATDGTFEKSETGEYEVQASYEYENELFDSVDSEPITVTVAEQDDDDEEDEDMMSIFVYVVPLTVILTVIMVFLSQKAHEKGKDKIEQFYKNKKRPQEWKKKDTIDEVE